MRRLTLPPGTILAPDGIVEAAVMAELVSAERIAVLSRQAIEIERDLAHGRIERERIEARQEGHAAGFEAFAAAVEALAEARRQLAGRLEALLRQCLTHALGSMPPQERLAGTLATVFGDLRQDQEIMVMVHPEELSALEEVLAFHRRARGEASRLRAEANPDLSPQDCLVYVATDVIDVGVPVMIEEMLAALVLADPGMFRDDD